MKHQLLVICTSAALFGCASPEQLRQQAMNTPAPDLCYYAAAGNQDVRQAAYYAIQARSVDCNAYAAIVAARIQQNQAQFQQGLGLLQAAQPKGSTIQQPQPVTANCRTYNRDTYVQTVCD